ncbi:Helix-turn-helix domain protein [Symmachiella dynata]|nr:Helix-turn-helix domain protein [Symmachiella dynata]
MTTKNSNVLLMSPRQAAAALAISPRTLWSLTAAGKIPHIRIGRSVRYAIDDLQDWIAKRKQGGDR